jgi:glycine/D-amino acid oxidase-like deaminating enzyme
MSVKSVLVVGAGCFGVTAAKELRQRGYSVTIVDELPNVDVEPHPLAASTDISKLIRGDYGGDKLYTEMWLDSIKGWQQLNSDSGETIFHQTGLLVMSSPDAVASDTDSFEQKSLATQKEYSVPVSLLSRDDIQARFPQWTRGKYRGYLNEKGGWAESGKAVVALLKQVPPWSGSW